MVLIEIAERMKLDVIQDLDRDYRGLSADAIAIALVGLMAGYSSWVTLPLTFGLCV